MEVGKVQPVTEATGFAAPPRRKFAENGSLGMALVIFTEIMLFAGFFSAFVIVRNAVPDGAWPPADQPRLPIERTAFNTLALLLSGVALLVAGRRFRSGGPDAAFRWMATALGLGVAFVVLQGFEWVALLRQGLTITSSRLGSFFYLIIGAHGLHAVAAMIGIAVAWRRMALRTLTESHLGAVQLFWYFVVLVWPFLYWRVYL